MVVELSGGFAVVGAGAWLFGRAQPAAVRGTLKSRRLKGFICPDRGALTRGELAEIVPNAKGAEKRSHAEPAKEKSRAESAEIAEKKSHAESAEVAAKSHAESAEVAESRRPSDSEPPPRGLEPSGEAAPEKETPRTSPTPRKDQKPEEAAHGAPRAWCASATAPFLTRIDCGVPVSAVSDKVLVAPAAARTGARLVKVVPLSFARALRVTKFASPADRPATGKSDRQTTRPEDHQTTRPEDRQTDSAWVVMATRSRTTRIALADGESLGVRPEAAVAWTGERPTGFCPRLSLLDVLLPRGPRELLLHFHGPAIVWIEGAEPLPLRKAAPRKAVF